GQPPVPPSPPFGLVPPQQGQPGPVPAPPEHPQQGQPAAPPPADGRRLTPEEYLNVVGNRLHQDGCEPHWEDWAGIRVLVGRRSDFRWEWMASRLHLFVIAAAVPYVQSSTVDGFVSAAVTYAKRQVGELPRGVKNRMAVIVALVSDRVDRTAVENVGKVDLTKAFQATEPDLVARAVVVDTSTGAVGFLRERPARGALFHNHLQEKTRLYFPPPAEVAQR
ncbi:hypothetical protein, partial [Carbonactinospora thermoautotrophica]